MSFVPRTSRFPDNRVISRGWLRLALLALVAGASGAMFLACDGGPISCQDKHAKCASGGLAGEVGSPLDEDGGDEGGEGGPDGG